MFFITAKSGPPEFVETLSNVQVVPGEDARLECQLGGGSPANKIEWFKDDKLLKEKDGLKFELTDDVCALLIPKASPHDCGVYQCVATNDSGSSTTTAELSIPEPVSESKADVTETEMPPVFTEEAQDGSVTVLDGGNVRLEARIGGVPTPVVEWFKDETPVDIGEHFVKIVDGDRHCLDIVHVSPGDSGTYKCVGTNHLGTVTRVYSLDIEGK